MEFSNGIHIVEFFAFFPVELSDINLLHISNLECVGPLSEICINMGFGPVLKYTDQGPTKNQPNKVFNLWNSSNKSM